MTPPGTVTTAAAMRERAAAWRTAGHRVGLVPTMGALHAGHAALLERARAECGKVVLSIFVNPRQFAPGEDLDAYPRTLDADLALAAAAGVDAVFAPDVDQVYPPGFDTTVRVGALADRLCGRSRPGHFDGVATVVCRLFGLCRPTHAYFGRKDYQQAAVLRRVARDLALEPEIVVCPTVREADGLALSSRNRYLSAAERDRARAVPEALAEGERRFVAGETGAEPVLEAVRAVLARGADRIDYVAACHPETLAPLTRLEPGSVLLVAAWFGPARLIDNRVLPAPA